jgi:hypothetical protein
MDFFTALKTCFAAVGGISVERCFVKAKFTV